MVHNLFLTICKRYDTMFTVFVILLMRLQLLDHPTPIVSELRETVLSTLLRLSRRTNIYPSKFSLTHITLEGQQPVAHGSFGDIYRGRLRDRIVCLKVLKTYKPSDASSLNKVSPDTTYPVTLFMIVMMYRPFLEKLLYGANYHTSTSYPFMVFTILVTLDLLSYLPGSRMETSTTSSRQIRMQIVPC